MQVVCLPADASNLILKIFAIISFRHILHLYKNEEYKYFMGSTMSPSLRCKIK